MALTNEPLANELPAQLPKQVADYDLISLLGVGGMATVARAIHRPSNAPVALKLLHPHLYLGDERIVRDFIREARVAAQVSHPNVVRVRDFGWRSEGVYIVLDLVEGMTLSELIRGCQRKPEKLSPGIIARILDDILGALHAAHEACGEDGTLLELVHRDVSPQNILVDRSGRALLTDFGIAKTHDKTSVTTTGIVKGKAGYLAPEQLRGLSVDRRTDIWAAGVVAWEMLCLRRLFPRSDIANVARALEGDVTPPSKSVPGLSPAVDRAILRALSVDASDRFENAEQFRREIVGALIENHPEASCNSLAEVLRQVGPIPDRSGPNVAVATKVEPIVPARRRATASKRTAASSQRIAGSPRSRRLWLVLAAALASGGALATAWGLNSASRPAKLKHVPHLAIDVGTTAAPEPTRKTELKRISVESDAPLRDLQVGTRRIPVDGKNKSFEIEISEQEAAVGSILIAHSQKGQESKVPLKPETTRVKLRFLGQHRSGTIPTRTKKPELIGSPSWAKSPKP